MAYGVKTATVEVDLSLVEAPPALFDAVEQAIGPVTALALSHCQSLDNDILGTTVPSFDRHFITAGLRPEFLHEFPQGGDPGEREKSRRKDSANHIPLAFSLQARKE